jgi:hypothetical protein
MQTQKKKKKKKHCRDATIQPMQVTKRHRAGVPLHTFAQRAHVLFPPLHQLSLVAGTHVLFNISTQLFVSPRLVQHSRTLSTKTMILPWRV